MTIAWIYGTHAVTSLFRQSPERVVRLYLQQSRDQPLKKLISQAEALSIPIQRLSAQEMASLLGGVNHQGVAAECVETKLRNESDLVTLLEQLSSPARLLILDGVQDPHNLGACLRSADAAGVHAVIIPKHRCAGMTATVSKVACGAAQTVPLITVTNLVRTLAFLQEQRIWCIGLDDSVPRSLYETQLVGSLAFVLGSEGEGLRRLTRERCDELVAIPMQGSVTSLNVSVATGVVLFEALRQSLFSL